MELTTHEQAIKAFMYNVFVPSLHNILKDANPQAYKQWGGNACRQTAIFGHHFLSGLLPDYEWTVWDGDFSDKLRGQRVQYNHAWNYGVDKKNNKALLVDLSRVNKERLFIPVKANKYPKNHEEYKDMKLIRKEKMDVAKRMTEPEYYTMLDSVVLLNKLDKIIMKKLELVLD
jgi:hypothetical protein